MERSIGKGGNGTITVVYFKGVEFAVKRVSKEHYSLGLGLDWVKYLCILTVH